jgi:uncharacterized protein YggE
MRTMTGFVGVILLLASGAAHAQAPPPPTPSIVTRGEAIVKRAPDQAWVSIAAETRASTPAEAQRLAAEAMTAVQAALKGTGLPADAIRTTGYSLQPDMQYEDGRARVRGYIARNQIEVRVDALDRLGAVLDAAGSSGATSLAGLRFDIKDRRVVERDALKLAVEDAMGRAKAIASGAGAALGPILRIDEFASEPRPMFQAGVAMMDRSAAPPTPVSPGELEITAHVTLTVAIK